MSEQAAIAELTNVDCRFEPRPWPFALDRRAEIDAHWRALTAAKPAMYNGRVLLMHRRALGAGTLAGAYLDTDYASFLAWRDFGFPDTAMTNCFAMAALTSREGHFVLGVMGPHTANAGMAYFPAGTPDLDDVAGDRVDLGGSVHRELEEETGLSGRDVTAEAGWTMVALGPRIALMKRLRSDLAATELSARIRGFLATQSKPELSGVHIVASPADITDRMPVFQRAYLDYALTGGPR